MFKTLRKIFAHRRTLLARLDMVIQEDNSYKNNFYSRFRFWPEGLEYTDLDIIRLSENASLGKYNKIILNKAKFPCSYKNSIISLGYGCWTGNNVELNILNGNQIVIKNYSTVQDFCKIIGDVTIEKYCALAPGAFISSGKHYMVSQNPDIRLNQDQFYLSDPELIRNHSKPVHIEEDCWLGYNCFINAGVYIGRGARIGANTVVTKDVMPYSLVKGSPGKEYINRRFDFFPPTKIEASNAGHWPYFYRGFNHKKDEIERMPDKNLVGIGADPVIIVLQKGQVNSVKFSGKIIHDSILKEVDIKLTCNGNLQYLSKLSVNDEGVFETAIAFDKFNGLENIIDDLIFRMLEVYNIFQFSIVLNNIAGKANPYIGIFYFEEILEGEP